MKHGAIIHSGIIYEHKTVLMLNMATSRNFAFIRDRQNQPTHKRNISQKLHKFSN